MKKLTLFMGHTLLFYFVLLLLMSFQSSIWLQFFSQSPAPSLWITFLVYGAFYRSLGETILLTYLTSFVASVFLNMPLGLLLLCNSLCMLSLLTFKSRFMVTNPSFLALLTLLTNLLFPLAHYLASQFFETNPIHRFEFFSWLISSLITALISVALFQFYMWLDKVTAKAWPTEVGGSAQ